LREEEDEKRRIPWPWMGSLFGELFFIVIDFGTLGNE